MDGAGMLVPDRERSVGPRARSGPTIIDAGAGAVLPLLPRRIVHQCLERLPFGQLAAVLRDRLLPVALLPDLVLYAAQDEASLTLAQSRGWTVVALMDKHSFLGAVHHIWGRRLVHEATSRLRTGQPHFSAHHRFGRGQLGAMAGGVVLVLLSLLLLPEAERLPVASLVLGIFFMSVIGLRILALLPAEREKPPPRLRDEALPPYTVLVPLFREVSVLDQLLAGLAAIDYPADRLDIKLLLEECDVPMHKALAARPLPDHFEVLVVPAGQPQTKPRALSFALPFARGSLLTIYDAEDIPEPGQLRRAAEVFACHPPELACLQARLSFYNPGENWLTRQCTLEYAVLFGLLLPAFAREGLPLPLGGTSNHFRIAALRHAGAWDPFNVTEDADLGMRFARLGYRCGVISSTTYEEANSRLPNWLRQRARWLEGFLQTWLVHMREPAMLRRELGWAGFVTMQAQFLGLLISSLFHPLFLVTALWLAMTADFSTPFASLAALLVASLSSVIFVTGHIVSMLAGSVALRHIGIMGWLSTVLTMPFYWLLISLAAWLALWQFVWAPFHWNKTEHGLSSFQRRA